MSVFRFRTTSSPSPSCGHQGVDEPLRRRARAGCPGSTASRRRRRSSAAFSAAAGRGRDGSGRTSRTRTRALRTAIPDDRVHGPSMLDRGRLAEGASIGISVGAGMRREYTSRAPGGVNRGSAGAGRAGRRRRAARR
ncbi:MAG: hypothetical protein MZV64_63115 [Ignavibacteriales bacterium]|nr:hypothetical protein [Ignavibacteriales bacterium]